jgi:hypothetical protein
MLRIEGGGSSLLGSVLIVFWHWFSVDVGQCFIFIIEAAWFFFLDATAFLCVGALGE